VGCGRLLAIRTAKGRAAACRERVRAPREWNPPAPSQQCCWMPKTRNSLEGHFLLVAGDGRSPKAAEQGREGGLRLPAWEHDLLSLGRVSWVRCQSGDIPGKTPAAVPGLRNHKGRVMRRRLHGGDGCLLLPRALLCHKIQGSVHQ